MNYVTSHEYPPIPVRQFDWSAVTKDYEPGAFIGRGATEQEAIADLDRKLSECEEVDESGEWK